MSSNDSMSSQYQTEIDEIRRLVVENYCILASSILLFTDFFLTFSSEVEHIWHRRVTGATVLFALIRYVTLAERVVFTVSLFLHTLNNESCVPVLRLDDTLTTTTYFVFGAFNSLRVWGIWGRDWKPLVLMVPLCLIRPIIAIYNQVMYTPIAFGPPLWGCGADFKESEAAIENLGNTWRASVIASDTLLIAFTWAKTYTVKREAMRCGIKAPLATLLLRDGTAYFAVILAVEILGIISANAGQQFVLFSVWSYFDQVLIAIFLSRFILDLRAVYAADIECATDLHLDTIAPDSNMRFASTFLGNLGAPLASGGDTVSWTSDTEDVEKVSTDPFIFGLYQSGSTGEHSSGSDETPIECINRELEE